MIRKYHFIVQDIDNSYAVLYAEGTKAKKFNTKKEAQNFKLYLDNI